MHVIRSTSGNRVILRLEGRLDTSTSSILEKELSTTFDSSEANIAMDLTDLVYISSQGLRVLLSAHKKCVAKGGELVLYNVSSVVGEVFEVTGFSSILTIK